MGRLTHGTIGAALVATFGFSSQALPYTGEQYAREAKITMDEAAVIALKAQPGKVIDRELEYEAGGSGLRYSFDIRNGNVTHEVGVDAQTGEILENSVEGPQSGLIDISLAL